MVQAVLLYMPAEKGMLPLPHSTGSAILGDVEVWRP
jgi:hypothetical protein